MKYDKDLKEDTIHENCNCKEGPSVDKERKATDLESALYYMTEHNHMEVIKYQQEQGAPLPLLVDSPVNKLPENVFSFYSNKEQEKMCIRANFQGNELASIEKFDDTTSEATKISRFELLNNYPEISEKLNAIENKNNGREVDNIEQER